VTSRAVRRLAATVVASATLLAAATRARADDASELEALLGDSIVSTASRAAEGESAAPATTTTLTAEDLRRYGIHSLDEAINYLALGMVTQNPLHSVDVGARGVLLTSDFGNHVLLLVDGHAVNEQWDGTAYFERGAAIPMELVDHIELTLGPGSVLYGSNAMLGVVHVVTKRAKDWDGLHLVAETELLTSGRLALGFGKELRLFGRPAEVTAMVEYYTQDGPTFTFGPQRYGDDAVTGAPKRFTPDGPGGVWGGSASRSYYTRIPSAYARLVVDNVELSVRAASYKRGTPYPNLFNVFSGDFDDPGTFERDRWMSFDLKHRAALSSTATLRSRLYGDIYEYDQEINSSAAEDCLEGQVQGCHKSVIGRSRWIGAEEQLSVDWLSDRSLVTLLGADARLRHVEGTLDVVDAVTGANPHAVSPYTRTEYAVGLYGQQWWRPTRAWGLNAGLRFDADERFGTKLSPRATTVLDVWSGGTLKGIYAEAFRSPTAYETSYADPSDQIAARDLKPETVRSVEVSFEQRFGFQRLLFGAFRSWWSDMVLLESLSEAQIGTAVASGQLDASTVSAVQYANVSSIDDYGFNAGAEGAVLTQSLRYAINLTGAIARRSLPDGSKVPLTVAPQVFGNARVSYDLPGDLPVLALAAQLAGRRPADRAFDGGFTPTPYAPTQLELRATVSGAVPFVPGLSFRVSADMATASRSPYVAGPIQAARPDTPSAELAPVDRFRTTLGLQYDLR
jgi:outer membrane receptor for ferrienterochelin and colicins